MANLRIFCFYKTAMGKLLKCLHMANIIAIHTYFCHNINTNFAMAKIFITFAMSPIQNFPWQNHITFCHVTNTKFAMTLCTMVYLSPSCVPLRWQIFPLWAFSFSKTSMGKFLKCLRVANIIAIHTLLNLLPWQWSILVQNLK